jgi:hypothetical protein
VTQLATLLHQSSQLVPLVTLPHPSSGVPVLGVPGSLGLTSMMTNRQTTTKTNKQTKKQASNQHVRG